jgi:hypothetical protein
MYAHSLSLVIGLSAAVALTGGCVQSSEVASGGGEEFIDPDATELTLDRPIVAATRMKWRNSTETVLVVQAPIDGQANIYEFTGQGHVEQLATVEDVRDVVILAERSESGSLVLGALDTDRRFNLLELADGELAMLAGDLPVRIESEGLEVPSTGGVLAPCRSLTGLDARRAASRGPLPNLCELSLDGSVEFLDSEFAMQATHVMAGDGGGDLRLLRLRSGTGDVYDVVRMDFDGSNAKVELTFENIDIVTDALVDATTGDLLAAFVEDLVKPMVLRYHQDGTY